MQTWIEIKKSAIINNYIQLKQKLDAVILAPVLKSNAYGHGLEQVYSILKDHFCPWICVNYLEEGIFLRELGYKGSILTTGPFESCDFQKAYDWKIDISLANEENLLSWLAFKDKPFIHIKVDTGLSRQGLSLRSLEKIFDSLLTSRHLIKGVMSHFANVEDVTKQEFSSFQLANFNEVCDVFEYKKFKVLRHIASSASTLLIQKSHFDMARVGISLYGFWPSQITRLSYLTLNQKQINLIPALSWYTRVSMLRKLKAGACVGYGCSFKANSDMRVAVLPLGYFEGYPRLAANHNAYVLCGGIRCRVLGRICMNMMIIDVSDAAHVKQGDLVTLIGQDGNETLTAETLASWAQTIQYEFVTRLNPKIPRNIVH